MRKNNTALVTVVFCISMLMIFVIAGRQINSQVINKSKSVNKTQPSADLSETGILSAADSSKFRQNGKARQAAVPVAPAVGADLGNETEPNDTFAHGKSFEALTLRSEAIFIPTAMWIGIHSPPMRATVFMRR